MQRLKTTLLALALALTSLTTLGLATATASAATLHDDACNGLSQLGGSADCNNGGSALNNVVGDVVTILSLIVGAAAVIMIIVAGYKYMTSGGDSGKVGAAKTTLIYALIGLAVAVLAQFLTHFVINKATNL